MSPKRSAKPSARKTKSHGKRAPKAESPMRKIEHAVGPNPDGQAHAARAAHGVPVVPTEPNESPPNMNTPPTSSPASSAVDEGQTR